MALCPRRDKRQWLVSYPDFLNLNKAIKMIEQASVLSGEEKSFIDSVWSLILVKSNQYTVEGFDFAEINDMLCFLVTS